MTPTMPKPGDIITVRLKVSELFYPRPGGEYARARVLRLDGTPVSGSVDILVEAVTELEPSPPSVGDHVTCGVRGDMSNGTATVLAIHGNEAWVLDDVGDRVTCALQHLCLAEAPSHG